MLAMTADIAPLLRTDAAAAVLDTLDEEQANLVAALDAFAAEPTTALYDVAADLYLSIGDYLDLRCFWVKKQAWGWALVQAADVPLPRQIQENTAPVVDEAGDPHILEESHLATLSHDDLNTLAEMYNVHGLAQWQLGASARSIAFFHQALKIHQHLGNPIGIAGILINMGHIYYSEGDFETCITLAEQALVVAKQVDNPQLEADVSFHLAAVLQTAGQLESAGPLLARTIMLRQTLDVPEDLATALFSYAQYHYVRGNAEAALPFARESLALMQQFGGPDMAAVTAWIQQVERELSQNR